MRGGEVRNDTWSSPSKGSPHLYAFLRDQIDAGIERDAEKMRQEWEVCVACVHSGRRNGVSDAHCFARRDVLERKGCGEKRRGQWRTREREGSRLSKGRVWSCSGRGA